jgi:hypothetical protein
MKHDIVTVARKELWEALNGGGGRGKWNLLFSLLVFGGFMPVQMGRTWIESSSWPCSGCGPRCSW